MIQMTRFEDRFDVTYDFTDEVYDALIPSMIIQPIVENAVKHGLEKSLRKGHLTIGGRKHHKDDTLVLWIYDTGVGMTTKKLEQIRKMLKDSIDNRLDEGKAPAIPDAAAESDSLGLRNVNSRIYLYYGRPYKLHIDSEYNIGTNIQIKIPFRTS
jgi:two-component system sensor histidine kinase YesM